MNFNCGIYCIKNLVNNKIYIGSSKNIKSRKYNHFYELRNNTHKNSYLQRSYNKYGKDNFIFYMLEYCSEDDITDREQFWMDITKCYDRDVGYNICLSPNNIKISEETREKLRIGSTGNKNCLGKKHTKEHIEKTANFHRGRKRSIETRNRISEKMSKYKYLVDKWIILYNNGYSYCKIGREYNVSASVVRSNLIKYNGNISTPKNKKYYHMINEVKQLYDYGYSYKQISEKLKIPYNRAYEYIKYR
jgi:group I intron endonuclease